MWNTQGPSFIIVGIAVSETLIYAILIQHHVEEHKLYQNIPDRVIGWVTKFSAKASKASLFRPNIHTGPAAELHIDVLFRDLQSCWCEKSRNTNRGFSKNNNNKNYLVFFFFLCKIWDTIAWLVACERCVSSFRLEDEVWEHESSQFIWSLQL